MTQDEVVARVVGALEAAHVTCMVVGSFASNVHGIPRSAHDADVVVDGSVADVLVALDVLDGEFYLSREAALEALARRRTFNLVHLESGLEIDLIVRKDRPFSATELQRRAPGPLAGRSVPFATAEDTFLTKLEWARAADSERQFEDACGIVSVQGPSLDWEYVRNWAPALGVEDLVARARTGQRFRGPA